MNPIRTLLPFLLLPLLAACSNNTTAPGAGYGPGAGTARLEVIGGATRLVDELSETPLQVRYVAANGAYIADAIVDFALEGAPVGATLSGNATTTDADGIATIALRAGSTASFMVVAAAPLAAEVAVIEIDVARLRFGRIDYTVDYAGSRLVQDAEVSLYTNITCDDLSRAIPAPRTTHTVLLGAPDRFDNVEVGVPAAAYALGIDNNDNVAAATCVDVTLTSAVETLRIDLTDIAELVHGRYSVVETYDVTSGFSPALDTVLAAMTGLTTDPAMYIVELVAAHSGTPGWLRTALSSRITRDLVADSLRTAIADIHVPGYLSDLAGFGASVDLAFTQLSLRGDLEIDEPNEFAQATGLHRVTSIEFPLRTGGTAERLVRVQSAMDVSFESGIAIREHALPLAFGQVVEMVLNDVLLPSLPGSPRTTGELLSGALDCRALGRSLGGSGTSGTIAAAVCDIGVTMLAARIDSAITELWRYDTLNLSGNATLTDTDMDYDRDAIEVGTAQARWTGTTGELRFTGVIQGTRRGDTNGRPHPARNPLR